MYVASCDEWKRSSLLAAVAGVVVLSVMQGCTRDESKGSIPARILELRKPNTTPPRYIPPSPKKVLDTPRTLLLFVHGIFGDTVKTWCNSNGVCLHEIVVQSSEFARNTDAFAFGYSSAMFKQGSLSISEAARALHTEVKFREFLKRYDRIVIVAHSMGGLVTLEMLTTYADLAPKVPLVVTYATPYDGSQIADLARNLLKNPALTDMIPLDRDNTFLVSLNNRWKEQHRRLLLRTTVLCAYEKLSVTPLLTHPIVAHSSAIALCDEAADPIVEDHIGIVKPADEDHQAYKVLVNALRTLDTATGKLVDLQTVALLAQVPDKNVRIELYKKITGDANPALEVLSILMRLVISDAEGSSFDIPLTAQDVPKVTDTASLAAFAPRPIDGVPCDGESELAIVNHRLICKNGMPVAFDPSLHSSSNRESVELIVFHTSNTLDLTAAIRQYMNPDLSGSPHLVIGRDGTVIQLVPFNRAAWHAGGGQWKGRGSVNRRSIGIMLINAGQLTESNGEYRKGRDGPVIPREYVAISDQGKPWQSFTRAQLEAATIVTKTLVKAYGIPEIAGHCHLGVRGKVDPGPVFPFSEIEIAVLGAATELPACS